MVLEEGEDATKKGSKTLDSEDKYKQTEKLATEIYNFCIKFKEIANELTYQQLYKKLSTLTEQLKTRIELRASLLFLAIIGEIKHPKEFIEGSVADQIIEKDTFIECNADNQFSEDEVNGVMPEEEQGQETKTVVSEQKMVQREETRETDSPSGETKGFKRLGNYRKNRTLMIELNSVFTEVQNIENELQKQLASLVERHRKAVKLTPSLILSVGTDDSEYLIEISEESLTVIEEVSEEKETKIERNTDEGQQHLEESVKISPQECKSTYLLVSALRSRLRALLHFCKDIRVVPVVKTLNLINDTYKCPEFEHLSEWKVYLWKRREFLKYCIQKKDIREKLQKIEEEKGFILSEIDNNNRDKKGNLARVENHAKSLSQKCEERRPQ